VNTESGGSLTQFPRTTHSCHQSVHSGRPEAHSGIAPNPTAPFSWNGRYVGVPDKNWDENYIVQQYMLGFKGDISEKWGFDVFAAYDQSKHKQVMHQAVLKSKVQQLLNAADGGASLCAGGFNPFGDANARALSPACVAFITKDATSVEKLGQTQLQARSTASCSIWAQARFSSRCSPATARIAIPSPPMQTSSRPAALRRAETSKAWSTRCRSPRPAFR
jgi:iron complex outermembrane receptor protein